MIRPTTSEIGAPAEAARLRAENERLRAALLKLKGMMGAPDCPAALFIDAALGHQQSEDAAK